MTVRLRNSVLCAYALLATGALGSGAQTPATADQRTVPMEKVTGIGGVFFRSTDPKGLAAWYERNLGVSQTPTRYGEEPWRQEQGPAVFEPFAATTKYFERPTQQWMIDFRVRNLDAMAAQLTRAGIAVRVDSQAYPNGRFARLRDPEGNPIELWEPKAASSSAGRTP
jgi:catechol 2,3-dioxygenase-like lactoylglutathione lyase family enzyme